LYCVVAVVRSAESWSAPTIIAGVLMLVGVLIALVVWAVRVVAHR